MKHPWPLITDPKASKIICLTFVRLIVKHLLFRDPKASKFICLTFVKSFKLTSI